MTAKAEPAEAGAPPPGQLWLNAYDEQGVRVLRIAGECDLATYDTLAAALNAELGTSPVALVIDLAQASYCDAGSVGLLIAATKRCRLAVAGATGIVERLLGLVAPPATLPRHPSVAHAARSLADTLAE